LILIGISIDLICPVSIRIIINLFVFLLEFQLTD